MLVSMLTELHHLCTLPRQHPSIIAPPAALVTISPSDDRVIGFLLEYHPARERAGLCD